MIDSPGRLGSTGVLFGASCAVGLLLFSAASLSYGGWFLMHDKPWVVLLGIGLMVASPFWLLFAIIDGIRYRGTPWRPEELASIIGVVLALAIATISMV